MGIELVQTGRMTSHKLLSLDRTFHTHILRALMLNSECLYFDWVTTIVITVAGVLVYSWPVKRFHPMISNLLCIFFSCYMLQFFLLEYATSQLERWSLGYLVGVFIVLGAIGVCLVLWLLNCIAELLIIGAIVMMIAQTSVIVISIPIAVVLGLIVWLMLLFSPVANIRHIVVLALFTSGLIAIGMGEMILETSVAIDNLPFECQEHFNMWVTCDPNCGSLVVYTGTAARVSVVIAWAVLFILRIVIVGCCTTTFQDDVETEPCFCCCEARRNKDAWVKYSDRNVSLNPYHEI
jgi:hypothetical protein